jgi:hypothetical protein
VLYDPTVPEQSANRPITPWARLERLEARTELSKPFTFRYGWSEPLPGDFQGERHIAIVEQRQTTSPTLGAVMALAATGSAILFHLTRLGIALTADGDHGEPFGLAIVAVVCSLGVLLPYRQELPWIGESFRTTQLRP